MKVVGLTGGIGSGKSTVAKIFSDLEIPIIDADIIARALVEPGMPALELIKKQLGSQFIDEKGQLNRPLLKQAIFKDDKTKTALEHILHPLIQQSIKNQVNTLKGPFCIVVIPLLAENIKAYDWLDKVIVVDVPESMQISRAMSRDNLDEGFVKSILAKQATRKARLAIADYVIDNSKDIHELQGQVFDLAHTLSKDLSELNHD